MNSSIRVGNKLEFKNPKRDLKEKKVVKKNKREIKKPKIKKNLRTLWVRRKKIVR